VPCERHRGGSRKCRGRKHKGAASWGSKLSSKELALAFGAPRMASTVAVLIARPKGKVSFLIKAASANSPTVLIINGTSVDCSIRLGSHLLVHDTGSAIRYAGASIPQVLARRTVRADHSPALPRKPLDGGSRHAACGEARMQQQQQRSQIRGQATYSSHCP
jgi:hypothetical protein